MTEGGFTELKDKIISLKHEWSSDYYRSIAEDYLQTTFKVLLKKNVDIDLKKVVACLNYIDLQELVRGIENNGVVYFALPALRFPSFSKVLGKLVINDLSAEDVANWVGTQDKFTLTAQLNLKDKEDSMGSVRVNKQFIVHPDEIKQQLKTGEAFYVSKVKQFEYDKIKVKFT